MESPGADSIYHRYWGKYDNQDRLTWHLLAYHCLDVAAVGHEILKRDPRLFHITVRTIPLPEKYVISLITFFLALHDIGKFSERFQGLNAGIQTRLQGTACRMHYSHHHTEMGMQVFMREIWPRVLAENWLGTDPDEDPYDLEDLFLPWIRAATGHHGKPVNDTGVPPNLFSPRDKEAVGEFAQSCATLFMNDAPKELVCYSSALNDAFSRTSWLIAGLVVLSDWIGSDSDIFTYHQEPVPLDEYWHRYAIPQAKEAVSRSGVLPGAIAPFPGIVSLLPENSAPTPLQKAAAECSLGEGPHLFIIEDVTGSGKTEAALALAHRLMEHGAAEGIFMGLPTMATANDMYRRFGEKYRQLFANGEHPSLVLAHSARDLSAQWRQSIGPRTDGMAYAPGEDEGSAECAAWLSDNRKKALLADIGVGTIDQAIISVLPLHHQSLRLLGLARHVLIVDEVHAYDEYMNTLLERLLQFHAAFGGSAILLSATLPIQLRQRFAAAYCSGLGLQAATMQETAYPLMTTVSARGVKEIPIGADALSRKAVTVDLTSSEAEVEAYLEQALQEDRCACWIRNTVVDAIETYKRLSERWGEDHVKLFHARFTMGDRQAIEDDVLAWFGRSMNEADRRGKILIATQVVEQSLDIDFDAMVTDLAPIDLIIQRAGRLHRHPRPGRSKPVLLVFSPPPVDTPEKDWLAGLLPRATRIYEKHGQLWLTVRLLAARRQIVMPDDARPLIEGVFSECVQASIPDALKYWERQADGKDRGRMSLAQINALSMKGGYADTYGQWQDDSRTPTRLGDAGVIVVLALWVGSELRPWIEGANGWEKSQVPIRESQVAAPAKYSGAELDEIERIKPLLPGKGEGRILIPLTTAATGTWEGRAEKSDGKEVIVTYDPKIGLQTHEWRR